MGRRYAINCLVLLTHAFTCLLTHSLINLLTYVLTHLLTHLLTYLLTHSLTYLLTPLLTYSFNYCFLGVKYVWGKANRYFFNFALNERENCIVAKGNRVERGSCSSSGALKWGLSSDGKLSTKNGKLCLVRHNDDTAGLARCNEANEYMSIVAPEILKPEDIQEALKNPNLSAEQRKALQEVLRQYAANA
jgi:hypothetical protein